MKWTLGEPTAGAMIRVKLGDIYHYGVYVSDGEVIQFGLSPAARAMLKDSEIEVLSSDIDAFLAGGFLEVAEFDRKERKKNRTPEDAVAFARAKLGMRGYNILYNNCEHFANECVRGVRSCSQADDVRALFRSMPVVDVYIAAIPEEGEIGSVFPAERDEEIRSTRNEQRKREKYYVWRLLAYALERSFGFRIKDMTLCRAENGRWSAQGCDFSLSHSDGVVAVAVSRASVGVDIEAVRMPHAEKFAERILTAKEQAEYAATEESQRAYRLIGYWTAKEALFKRQSLSSFSPSLVETGEGNVRLLDVTVNGAPYRCAVATDTPERIRVYANIDLNK